MVWRTAHSIPVFHHQQRVAVPAAAPPATPVTQWGTIADPAHSSTSDHAPKDFPGWGNDIVTAADSPHRPDLGLDQGKVGEALRVSRDPRIKYFIFNRRIFSSYTSSSGRSAWAWGPYSGENPHTTHSHLSVVGDARADGQQAWQIGYKPVAFRDDLDAWYVMHRLAGLQAMANPIVIPAHAPTGTPARSEPNALAVAITAAGLTDEQLARLEETIAEAAAVIEAAPSLTAIGDVVDRELDEFGRGGADTDPPATTP